MDFRNLGAPTTQPARQRNLGFEVGIRDVLQAHSSSPTPPPSNDTSHAKAARGGSRERYLDRIDLFKQDDRPMPRLRHHALWMLHNCVAHPLLAVTGRRVSSLAVEFHELTSLWLNHLGPRRWRSPPSGPDTYRHQTEFRMPEVRKAGFWMLHNVIAHAAIGLVPCKTTFDAHDWTARLIDVPGWV